MKLRVLSISVLIGAAFSLTLSSRAAEVTSMTVWQHLPVLENGRVMPLDSYARNVLLAFSGRSTFNKQPAARWLARVLFTPDDTRDDIIFLVNNPEVVEALGLTAKGRGRYSFAQLESSLPELTRLARAAFHLEDAARSPVEKEIMQLYSNLALYSRLTQGLDFAVPRSEFDIQNPKLRHDLDVPAEGALTLYDLRIRKAQLDALMEKHGESEQAKDDYGQELFRAAMAVRMWSEDRHDLPPALIPIPAHAGGQQWIGAWDALQIGGDDEEVQHELGALRDMSLAFRAGQQLSFDLAARTFLNLLSKHVPDPRVFRKIKLEVQYNGTDAFYRAELFYGFAFIAALLSVAFRGRWVYRSALILMACALAPHTYGIIARMAIMGRPPVTNLYATFIFVSWVCVVIGLAVEYFQRNRLGLITASSIGLAMLMTSARFGSEGDTMGVMVAVLDSNFWLATHVVCISIGYAGCCAAGLLGHIYLLQALRRAPDDAALKETDRAVFGALAFGLIFSFLGTMLGGIWADQSWGRFWGWDPKENGALVIVLWSAIVFHARAGRMIGPRGFAAGAVLGVIGVLSAWIGVNLLGVGLHSYGFTSGLARGLAISCLVEIAFVSLTVPFARQNTRATV